MDHGPPDPKRSRVEAWTNGDERRALPPLNRPHQHQYPPPPPPSSFSRPQLPHAPPHPPVPHQLEDRRHEAGFGPLQQEPQRTMSFTNPMYATYPPREAVVKRDPSSPSPAQYQPQPQPQPQPRPNSTGHNNLEHMSVLHLDDHRRPSMPAYDAPPPPNYHSVPPYHPLGTPTFNPPYEQHAAYGPPPTPSALRDQMYGVAYAESAVGVRRKAPRTSQACKQCRQAKAKCDDPKPCTKCKKEGLVCDYTPPEPKQADKAVNEMMEMLKSLVQRQDNVERVLKLMAPEHEDLFAAEDASKKEEEEEEEVADMYEVQPNPSAAPEGQAMSQGASGFHYQGPMREGPASIEGAEEEEEEGERLPFPNTEPAIPVNHTTPAQRMLRWTGISKYVDAIMKDPKIKSVYYPFNREVKRGLLRLYSRGEGSGRSYSADKESGMVEPSGHGTGDSISTPEASASPDTLSDWGLLNDFSLTNEVAIYYRKGGLNATANDLEVDEATVRRLAGKYMDCINNMHPIILPAAMENMIRQFLKEVPDHKPAATKNPLAGFAGDSSVPFKRKRSVETIEVPTVAPPKARWARRSIHTALMLMILALGKICEHTGPIPDVVHENEPQAGGSAYFRNGYPSPTNASPVVSPQAPSGPSPKEGELRVRFRRGSTGASLQPRRLPATPRNRDVIPGLAYFAEATNILGNQLGGNTIHHVHANILACLYYGQLARVAESHASIHSANRALYNLLKPKFDTFRQMSSDPHNLNRRITKEQNQILVAFWTGLQLETDILAELDFPPSEITRWGEFMPFPDIPTLNNSDLEHFQCISYVAQLWLRRHLNQLHRRIYCWPEDTFSLSLPPEHQAFKACEEMEYVLPQINIVAGPMFWDENDPPADNILHARLRAKHHGAAVLTYRPFLKMILDRPRGSQHDPSAVCLHAGPSDGIPTKVLDFAERCIRAMERSTSAFLGMKGQGRLIVTNVWGTSHAQWGNVIVLLGCYRDEILSRFIDEETLKGHVRHVIDFLQSIAQPSSALKQDVRILSYMVKSTGLMTAEELRELGVEDEEPMMEGSSFSSSAST